MEYPYDYGSPYKSIMTSRRRNAEAKEIIEHNNFKQMAKETIPNIQIFYDAADLAIDVKSIIAYFTENTRVSDAYHVPIKIPSNEIVVPDKDDTSNYEKFIEIITIGFGNIVWEKCGKEFASSFSGQVEIKKEGSNIFQVLHFYICIK
jgi:hypothetical protein